MVVEGEIAKIMIHLDDPKTVLFVHQVYNIVLVHDSRLIVDK